MCDHRVQEPKANGHQKSRHKDRIIESILCKLHDESQNDELGRHAEFLDLKTVSADLRDDPVQMTHQLSVEFILEGLCVGFCDRFGHPAPQKVVPSLSP